MSREPNLEIIKLFINNQAFLFEQRSQAIFCEWWKGISSNWYYQKKQTNKQTIIEVKEYQKKEIKVN